MTNSTANGENDLRRDLADRVELSAAEVTDQVARDQAERWGRGERVLVETYFGLHVALADESAQSELIYAEVLLRESHGEAPVVEEYCFRFPAQAESIRSLFQLHRAFAQSPSAAPSLGNGGVPGSTAAPARKSLIDLPGFDVLEEVGRGGMGIVYRARQLGLDRIVAIKMIRSDEDDPNWEARLHREAEAVGQLQHSHIVQVFGVGTHAGHTYMVLEFVAGGTLADRLKNGPLPPRDAAALMRSVALAVHAAHQHQIIHRDLKPGNILLSSAHDAAASLEPKVADFGLAKRLDQIALSRTGEVIGTPHYMAPEQASGGKKIEPPADVYAMGAILYECLTGRPPFTGDSPISVLMQVANTDPLQPSRLRTGLPRDLESVCLKCLEKNPARRYFSAQALADDLDRFLEGSPTVARPLSAFGRGVRLMRRYPFGATLVLLCVVSLVTGMAGVLWQWREAVSARGQEATQRRNVERSLYYGRLTQAVLLWESGDTARARELIAECRPETGHDDLRNWEWHYLNNAFKPETRVEKLGHWVYGLAIMPAVEKEIAPRLAVAVGKPRSTVAFYQPTSDDGRTGFLSLTGNESSRFEPGPKVPGGATTVAVHPQGTAIAWGVNTGQVVLCDAAGRELKTVTLHDMVTHLLYHPDGQTLYVVVANESAGRLYALDSVNGNIRSTYDGRFLANLAIEPSGRMLAYGGDLAHLLLLDPTTLKRVGELRGERISITSMAFSNDGARLAIGCDDGTLRWWDCATRTEARHWPAHSGSIYGLACSDDGKLLITGGADRTIRVWQPETGHLVHTLRGHEASVRCVRFLPQGIVSGAQDGTVRFWETNRDYRGRRLPFHNRLNGVAVGGSGDEATVSAIALNGLANRWSMATGQELSRSQVDITARVGYPVPYTSFLDGGLTVVGISRSNPKSVAAYDASTGATKRTWPEAEGHVACLATDPTDRYLAWATTGDKGSDIRWCDTKENCTAEPVRCEGPVRGIAISADGRRIAAVLGVGQGSERTAWVLEITGDSSPRKILRHDSMRGGLAFHPDGSQFALAFGDFVQVYRTDNWTPLFRFGSGEAATSLAYSPDGRRLAAVGYNGVVILADTATGERVFRLRGLAPNRPNDMACDARVAFSPDGHWLVSTNWDGSLNLWDGRPDRR